MSGVISQLGTVDEVTYGTPVTVTKFHEIVDENIQGQYARIESSSLRAASRVQRSDRWALNPKGASGPVQLEVMSKGFGFWLKHMMGSVVTTGPTETTAYNHSGRVAALTGDSFTLQVGRPDIADVIRPFTYEGGKITGWELSNSVDGFLMCRLDCDFEAEGTATGLATASYPTGMEILNFVGGLITVGGSNFDATDITIRANNNLKTDRYFIRQNSLKKEPLENGAREYSVSMTCEFVDLVTYNRVAATTNAAAMGDVVAKWEGGLLAGATTIKAGLHCTMDTVRFDAFGPAVQGPELLTATLEGRVLDESGANGPVVLDYKTLDVTP